MISERQDGGVQLARVDARVANTERGLKGQLNVVATHVARTDADVEEITYHKDELQQHYDTRKHQWDSWGPTRGPCYGRANSTL